MPDAALPLSAGLAVSDRMEALLDGRVEVEGCALAITCRPPQQLFRAVLRDQTFDLSEFSLGSHIAAVGAGRRDYVGLPVFLSRAFRHSNVYVRTDKGIEHPSDLRGRRIGVADFHQTAAVWVRGLLADDYGVERTSVTWITGGLSAPVLEDRAPLSLPAGFRVERSSQTLNALLEAGEIDALISPIAPDLFMAKDSRVDRLWPDYVEQEHGYFGRTGLFPIMHLLVLRRTCAEQHAWLAEAVTSAFLRAKVLAEKDLAGRDYPKIASAWLMADRTRTLHALGRDPWTYGLAPNRAELDVILRYAHADGLTPQRLTPEALFSTSTQADGATAGLSGAAQEGSRL